LKKLTGRLSYANVVSSICLFLLLGGATAFAAVHLGKNSVGRKQLKKNAVTGAKVKNHSLTGKDIKLSKLGKVPSAATADTANGLAPLEATHLVGGPGEPPFLGGSANGSAVAPALNLPPVGFYKDHEGIVHLEGIAIAGKSGGSGITPIFNLPAGFRPQAGLNIFSGFAESATFIAGTSVSFETLALNGGDVAAPEEELVVLSGVSFRAAN
jgi:hypothetical protein